MSEKIPTEDDKVKELKQPPESLQVVISRAERVLTRALPHVLGELQEVDLKASDIPVSGIRLATSDGEKVTGNKETEDSMYTLSDSPLSKAYKELGTAIQKAESSNDKNEEEVIEELKRCIQQVVELLPAS